MLLLAELRYKPARNLGEDQFCLPLKTGTDRYRGNLGRCRPDADIDPRLVYDRFLTLKQGYAMKFRFDFPGYAAIVAVVSALCVSSIAVSEDAESNDDQYRRILQQSILSKNGDVEILIREHVYPPSWQAPTHYHDGDLFIYVVEGEFEVSTDGDGKVIFSSGEAMQMAAETIMDARNASETEPLKLVIFQIGEPGGPFLVPVE